MGEERAREVVREAIAATAPGSGWSDETAERVVSHLSAVPGVVGASARLLRARSAPSSPSLARATAPRAESAGALGGSDALVRLVSMLGASLGDAKARSLVDEAVARRRIARERFSKDDAITVLEDLAGQPGLVGTVARFAKARVHLEIRD